MNTTPILNGVPPGPLTLFLIASIAAALALLATIDNAPIMTFLSGMVTGVSLVLFLHKLTKRGNPN